MVQVALDKKPAALALAALDTQALIPQLEAAQEAGIPVVGFDSGVDSDIVLTTAATDNIAAAAMAADKMAEFIGEEGQVAVIVHDQTSRTGIDRRDGFLDQMAAEYPNIEIVDVQYGGGDQLKSTDLAKAIIQAHPDLVGFFGANEGSIIGVLNAVTEMGKEGEIVIIGYDSGKQQIDAIKSGLQAGAITQDPIGIGYKSVEAAVKALAGEELPKEMKSCRKKSTLVSTGSIVVTSTTTISKLSCTNKVALSLSRKLKVSGTMPGNHPWIKTLS